MTIGLKSPSNYYMELINEFPPRPIGTEVELIATQTRIHSVLDNPHLTQDDRDYLKVLGMLVYDYEEHHEPMPTLKGAALLKALMEEANLQPHDLVTLLGNEAMISEILDQRNVLTDRQVQALASFFHISPSSFA